MAGLLNGSSTFRDWYALGRSGTAQIIKGVLSGLGRTGEVGEGRGVGDNGREGAREVSAGLYLGKGGTGRLVGMQGWSEASCLLICS